MTGLLLWTCPDWHINKVLPVLSIPFCRSVRSHTLGNNDQLAPACCFSSKCTENNKRALGKWPHSPEEAGSVCTLSMGVSYKQNREVRVPHQSTGACGLVLTWKAICFHDSLEKIDDGHDFQILETLASLAHSLVVTGAILSCKKVRKNNNCLCYSF